MWAEVNGERKKVACGPCIRGHRSSKCDHRDRVLVEVRKPGRPLSSCPHPSGSCSCERIVINYTIPKSSECACPSERSQSTATVAGNSRVQKNRRRSTAVNSSAVERALKTTQDTETDTSSITRAPTDKSVSDGASPISSASSTPRLLPQQVESISSCCQPKAVAPTTPKQASCCSSEPLPKPEPAKVKSCCPISATQPPIIRPNTLPNFGQQFQFRVQPQMSSPLYQSPQPQCSTAGSFPFGFGAPIYNHAAAAYQQKSPVSMSALTSRRESTPSVGSTLQQTAPKHNCCCGDSCSCFGCADHPNNATMMEYVRLMAQFQYTGGFGTMPPPLYDLPMYPHQAGYGAEVNQPTSLEAHHQTFHTPTPASMTISTGIGMSNPSSTQMSAPNAWQPHSLAIDTSSQPQYMEPASYAASTPIRETQPFPSTEGIPISPAVDTPDENREEEASTLSPSSYFWNQMVLPGCDDATGTCQCGDGCECVGCLTHGGHNGVKLEAPSLDHHEAFSEFTQDSTLLLAQPTNYIDFLGP